MKVFRWIRKNGLLVTAFGLCLVGIVLLVVAHYVGYTDTSSNASGSEVQELMENNALILVNPGLGYGLVSVMIYAFGEYALFAVGVLILALAGCITLAFRWVNKGTTNV